MNRLSVVLASHVALGLAYACSRYIPFGIPTAILIPGLVLLFPGLLFIKLPRRLSWAYWAEAAAVSSGILLLALIGARLSGLHLSSWHAWVFLWFLLLVAMIARPGHVGQLGSRLIHALVGLDRRVVALFAVGFLVTYASAMWIVPPQQDQDMVIANPTYGYLQHGKPYGTETHFAFIFSKPPLYHLQVGACLLLLDWLEPAYFYWQSGRIVELRDEAHWAIKRFRKRDVECFDMNLGLVRATRLLPILYGAIAPLLLSHLALALGASATLALTAGFVYLTLPEVVIRAGYAGFTAPSTVLLALSALLLLGRQGRSSRALLLAGMLLALTNQKMLFVPALYAAYLVIQGKTGLFRALRQPWLWGVAMGTALWWTYGALVDWSTFLRDHVYYDFRDRFLFQDLSLGGAGAAWYPGIGGLWAEWARNLTPPLLLLGVAGVLWGVWKGGRLRFFSLWAVLGWILASVTDWRQTKHLMLTIVPMTGVAASMLSHLGKSMRRVIGVVVTLAIAYNLYVIVRLWNDFDWLSPSTIW